MNTVLNIDTNKRIIVKKDGKTHELSTDDKISDLLDIIIANTEFFSSSKSYNSNFLNSSKKNFVIQINQSNGFKIKSVFKDEYLSGKSDLDELKHPFFSDPETVKRRSSENFNIAFNNMEKLEITNGIDNNANRSHCFKNASNGFTGRNKEILCIGENDKIMVFSPHPDDEILGACGLLYKCFNEKHKIKVVYMTSGKGGGDVETRKNEAIKGIKKIGGEENQLIFTNMPFYEKKDRLITDEDYTHTSKIIEEFDPTTIFICSDIFDPNGTHRKCYDILLNLYNSGKHPKIKFYFYYSVWYWPKPNEYSHILPYDYETYKNKIYAMLEHKSQLVNKFMGADPRPFYQRATARDGHYGSFHNCDFCEVYYLLNQY